MSAYPNCRRCSGSGIWLDHTCTCVYSAAVAVDRDDWTILSKIADLADEFCSKELDTGTMRLYQNLMSRELEKLAKLNARLFEE